MNCRNMGPCTRLSAAGKSKAGQPSPYLPAASDRQYTSPTVPVATVTRISTDSTTDTASSTEATWDQWRRCA